ncbi:MAG: hypothetical protein P4L87_00990 [Formivibrio sp.]|nr:hypothetical protein [Formivibrio sp.]
MAGAPGERRTQSWLENAAEQGVAVLDNPVEGFASSWDGS